MQVRTLACHHKVTCLGYAFAEFRKRLIPELEQQKQEMLAAGKQAEFGKMMASLRKEDQVLEEEYAHPLFVFMGDTHADIYADQDWLWDYPYLLTECTYIDPDHLENADYRLHTHWEQLRPHVLAHPGTTFVLTHFSLRYSDAEVIAFFEAEREKYGFENVLVWCSVEPAMKQQGQRTG
jgi:ribonuclease Z